MRKPIIFFMLILLFPLTLPGVEQIAIREWKVPWEGTRPRDPFVAPNGRVWFVGQAGHYAAFFNPADSTFTRFDLEAGTGPHNVIVADDGMVWYAGNLKAHIGKLDPTTGKITQYPMPDPQARDPHTLVFDGQGNIWFTVQWGNFLGRLAMQSGRVELFKVPTPQSRPYGIAVDQHARPWAVELGSNKLVTVDPKTLQLQEIELPRKAARPRRIEVTSEGHIWYVDYAKGYLGRYVPATGKFREWLGPAGEQSGPYGMAVDDKDRLWYVETWPSPNRLVGFDPKTETFFSLTPIPSGAGAVRHMVFHLPTRAIWFGTDTNNLGRALVP